MIRSGLYISISILLVLLTPGKLFAQSPDWEIEGYVVNKNTGDPVSYANIFNLNTKSGTISNSDGFFSIRVSSYTDSIRISFIGFRSTILQLSPGQERYIVRLEEASLEIEEIVVTYKEDPFLYELLNDCRKEVRSRKSKSVSRGYFEQKSRKDEEQIELVEGFYNVYLDGGHDISAMKLKTGQSQRFFGQILGR